MYGIHRNSAGDGVGVIEGLNLPFEVLQLEFRNQIGLVPRTTLSAAGEIRTRKSPPSEGGMLSNYTTAACSQTTCDRDWHQAHRVDSSKTSA